MSWKELNKDSIRVLSGGHDGVGFANLVKLAEEYGLVKYSEYDSGTPVISFLESGDFRRQWNNPKNGEEFRKKFGVLENPMLSEYPVWDHVTAFLDKEGKGYLVLNPYLSDEGLKSIFDNIIFCRKDKFSDYSNMVCEILGKDLSYWNPGKANLVVLYSKEK